MFIETINILGDVSMQKVKVQRYISGKRPEYAQYKSSDEESESEDFIDRRARRCFANRGDENFNPSRKQDCVLSTAKSYNKDEAADDRRLRRLARHEKKSDSDNSSDGDGNNRESRLRRYRERYIQEPEVLKSDQEELPSQHSGNDFRLVQK